MIYILYGQSGSGKTTLSTHLAEHFSKPTHIIDGDQIRKLTGNYDYSRNGRVKNITGANKLATRMHDSSCNVIVALVNPYKHLRDQLKQMNSGHVIEILLTTTRPNKKDYHTPDFEPGFPDICLNTNRNEMLSFESLTYMLDNYQLYP